LAVKSRAKQASMSGADAAGMTGFAPLPRPMVLPGLALGSPL
jgi:hypothetical protein